MNEHNLAKQSDKDKQNSDYLNLVELNTGTEHQTKNHPINKQKGLAIILTRKMFP